MPAQPVHTSITMFGSPPWGFRISGGKEFHQPLVVARVTPGSLAKKHGMKSGDVLVSINNELVSNMTQAECETKIKQETHALNLVLEKKSGPAVSQQTGGQVRSSSQPAPPTAPKGGRSGYALPGASTSVFDPSTLKQAASIAQGLTVMQGPGKSKVVHAQYNTPMGIYSNDNIIDTVQAQAKSVGVSLPGAQDESAYTPDTSSPVYRMVHEQDAQRPKVTQSRSFRILSDIVQE